MPETSDFDWNAIHGIDFSFGKLPNPADADKHGCLNQAFSQHLYYEETESLFITHKDGTKTLGLNPVTILCELIIDEIFDCLPSKARTETTKQHIVTLFKDASGTRLHSMQQLDKRLQITALFYAYKCKFPTGDLKKIGGHTTS
eukprot:jgi/Psemu1/14407/gm1.14407_g